MEEGIAVESEHHEDQGRQEHAGEPDFDSIDPGCYIKKLCHWRGFDGSFEMPWVSDGLPKTAAGLYR